MPVDKNKDNFNTLKINGLELGRDKRRTSVKGSREKFSHPPSLGWVATGLWRG